jgi:hypothetical protein
VRNDFAKRSPLRDIMMQAAICAGFEYLLGDRRNSPVSDAELCRSSAAVASALYEAAGAFDKNRPEHTVDLQV